MAFTAEQQRAYRAKRKAEGNPVPSGPSGKNVSKMEKGKFVAFDSEGAEIDGKHQTVLWACAWQDDHGKWEHREIFDANGLNHERVYEWMLSLAVGVQRGGFGPRTAVIFGGSYDFNMLMNHLDYDKAKKLYDRQSVLSGDYNIGWIPRRRFTIGKLRDRNKPLKKTRYGMAPDCVKKFSIYDIMGFFQTNFVAVIDGFLGKDYEDRQVIINGKKRRDSFSDETAEYIIRYTRAELRALVRVMDLIKQGLDEVGLSIPQWYGAGSVGGAMLKKHGIKDLIRKFDDPKLNHAIACAYFGGRIEAMRIGRIAGPIYHYDINSAYPAAQVELPDLNLGAFVYHQNPDVEKLTKWSVVHVEWCYNALYPQALYPFPWRREIDGSVFFPIEGRGWYWMPEIAAARRHFSGKLKILEAYEFVQTEEGKISQPFFYAKEYYLQRQALVREAKKTGVPNMMEKILKLGLNSQYGKLAQTMGGTERKPPAYHSLMWAGLITSITRAKLYDAAMQAPDDVIAIATDGLWSQSPLKLPCSAEKVLGEWEADQEDELVILQSGVYWFRKDGNWGFFCRGINKVPVSDPGHHKWVMETKKQFLDALKNFDYNWFRKGKKPFATVSYPARQFLTLGAALASRERFKLWCHWIDAEKEMRLLPNQGKRVWKQARLQKDQKKEITNAHRVALRTQPGMPKAILMWACGFTEASDGESAPHNPKWKEDYREAVGEDQSLEIELGLEA